MLFLAISLLIGASVGVTDTNSSNPVSSAKVKKPCENIKIQQREIFEKLARIENEINTKNIID